MGQTTLAEGQDEGSSLYGSWELVISNLDPKPDGGNRTERYQLFTAPLENELGPDECWSYLSGLPPRQLDHCLNRNELAVDAEPFDGERRDGTVSTALARAALLKWKDGKLTSFSDVSKGYLRVVRRGDQEWFEFEFGPFGAPLILPVRKGATRLKLDDRLLLQLNYRKESYLGFARLTERLSE
ncbi:MAG: hypothetical protein KDA66_14055 [Planctomycetaceae bacterium]|nr:hypothetical protein [Planctomycetaceae bacterium]